MVTAAHDASSVTIAVLEHDAGNPPLLLGDWLTEAGARLDVRRLHAHDDVPADTHDIDAVVSLGGALGVFDDEKAPWLAETRGLLARCVADGTPVFAVGLGAQLLAVAAGGRVERASDGYRLGSTLTAKRDATEHDLLFGEVPITPDVMQFHRDVIRSLPGGSEVLLASLADPIEAFRIGSAAWGVQFHIETPADVLRGWRADEERGLDDDDVARSDRRFGAALDESAELMAVVWRAVAHRFVDLVRTGIAPTPTGRATPRLPITASEIGG